MIRKNLIKSLSVVMAAMLAIMTVACGQNTVDSSVETAVTQEAEEKELEDSIVNASGATASESEAGKVETVYVTADANGAVNDVIVSEWLKNAAASSQLTDSTELQDIVNVKGSETFNRNNDGTLTWNADGSDIFYQGTTDKELPVSMKITYTLDGKEISPEELAGKSGKVTIRFEYENTAKQTVNVDGKDIEVYTPFAMVSGMMLDSDKFSNVEISNGKVISDGGKYIVMGVALPGLKESLNISDDKWEEIDDSEEIEEKLSNSFEITADTKDFELGMTVTMASSDLLSDFGMSDLSDSDEIEDIKDDMGQLRDGAGQLVDGTYTLKDGTAALLDGTQALYDGTSELKNGTADLKDGTGKLYTGTSDLKDGTSKLQEGIGAYTDGASKINDGAGKLADGAKALKDGTSTLKNGMESKDLVNNTKKLADGSAMVSAGVGELATTLQGLSSAMAGVAELEEQYKAVHAANLYLNEGGEWNAYAAAGINVLSHGQLQTQAQVDDLRDTAQKVEGGVSTVSGGLQQLQQGASKLVENYDDNTEEVETGVLYADPSDDKQEPTVEPASDPVTDPDPDTTPVPEPSNEDETGTPANTENTSETPDVVTDNTDETTTYIIENEDVVVDEDTQNQLLGASLIEDGSVVLTAEEYAQYQALIQYQQAMAKALPELVGSINQLAEGSAQLPAGMEAVEKYNSLCGAAAAADTSLGSVMAKMSGLSMDTSKLAQLQELVAGAQQVAAGNAALASGMSDLYNGAAALDNGASQLYSGATQLADGTSTLVSNNEALRNGIAQLNDGASQLYDGAGQLNDGAGKLNDGAVALYDGAGELNDGAGKLDEGVQELLDGVVKLDEEGIEKLYEAFDGDLTDFADRITAIQKAGSNYTSFGGTEDGVDSSVKFIIKTDSIKNL